MAEGYLSLVLHAHLPFVHHPEREDVLEERWFFEALSETYIPLIEVFEGLVKDDVPFRLTISLSAPLIAMMKNPLLQERYIRHLDKCIELSAKELERTSHEPHFHGLALYYFRRFHEIKEIFVERYNRDLTVAFKNFQDLGCLELITSSATHAFLPLIQVNARAVDAQIRVARDYFEETFGRRPKGIWLPECSFIPGIDEVVAANGFNYFFLDTHGIMHADPRPRYNVFAPIVTPSGAAAFGRDEESSKEVWSSKEGYPGDPDYREYYKDLGFEREYDYIKPYIHPEGFRINTGLKYWRITGTGEYKEAYRPDWAQKKAAEHAQDFLDKRSRQIRRLRHWMDRKPIITAPYDAELYGHWWFEGPMWIDFLARKIHFDQNVVKLRTPSDYLEEYPVNQMAMPGASSWGHKGFNEFWLNETNDWIYRHLHMAADRMQELADSHFGVILEGHKESLVFRALNQAARELLLAQSSDWPFIMRTGTMVDYACRRVKTYLNRFNRLYESIRSHTIDETWLKVIESQDCIFEELNCAQVYLNREDVLQYRNRIKQAALLTADLQLT